jgi:manganese/iron transport system substrate-binding protein
MYGRSLPQSAGASRMGAPSSRLAIPPARQTFTVAVLARRLGSFLTVALVLVALLSGCGVRSPAPATGSQTAQLEPIPLAPGQKLRVVATTSIVGDIVRQVGGDRIDLITLMGVGIDPHTYVATPSDTAAVHDAHLLFLSGAGLEEGLSRILQSASGTGVEVQLSDGLQLLPALQANGAQQPDRGAQADEVDPHTWFDVQNVIHWVQSIRGTLSALDPANGALYQANAAAYTQELEALDAWILGQVASIPQDRRKLVTNHVAFGYFAHRYGFEQVGAIYPLSPSSEPSAQDLAALEAVIAEYGVPVVFTESTVSPKLADQVARDMGVKLVRLYTGSLGGPGSGAESYIDMMRYDVQAIVAGLR